MKIGMAIAMAAAIGGNTWAAERSAASEHSVTVCIEQPPEAAGLPSAEHRASQMFASIGVKLDWRLGHSCPAGDGIRIGLSMQTAAKDFPGALAYAAPYEGVHVVVFYDRIKRSVSTDLRAAVLAHVLVHEITHILEGIDRHSESGVMKAHWSEPDYAAMRNKPLPFADEDVQLIDSGLATRGVRLAARNGASGKRVGEGE